MNRVANSKIIIGVLLFKPRNPNPKNTRKTLNEVANANDQTILLSSTKNVRSSFFIFLASLIILTATKAINRAPAMFENSEIKGLIKYDSPKAIIAASPFTAEKIKLIFIVSVHL